MDVSFTLLPPAMPDVISYEVPPGKREDGFEFGSNQINVKDLSREQALKYSELIKSAFLLHWQNKVAPATSDTFGQKITIKDIDTSTKEGKLVLSMLAIITTSHSVNIDGEVVDGSKLSPDEILQKTAAIT